MRNLTKISQTSSGTYVGLAAADKVALHGAAPCVQAAAVTAVDATAATSTLAASLNAVITALKNKGITA